ncbi:hypothetical protein BD289DRAFT_246728 [Coniella lustricola]|uniref:Uncharacterized protein n=1 Tax=Coniella lustricola TaxID=2025994 RepID=A0A2T3A8X5_9PEZI|nr:hypothetical protein BD289DRAFT_246728 [Coniella lustricola]
MANGLDRLERLFSKGKKSAASRHTAESNANSNHGSPEPPSPSLRYSSETLPPNFFPPTPFIRPRANVMQPRNELTRSSVDRSDSPRSQEFLRDMAPASFDTARDVVDEPRFQSEPPAAAAPLFHIPSRTSSLLARRYDRLPGGLAQLQIPRDLAFNETFTVSSKFPDPPTFCSNNERATAPTGLLDPLPIYPTTRIETPPPSDQDEFRPSSSPRHKRKQPKALLELTPEPSPEMIPARESLLSEFDSSKESRGYANPSPTSQRSTSESVPLLDDLWRDSYVCEVNNPVCPKTKVVLHNPSLQDFLAMADEDLAELRTAYPSRPPPRRAPPPPVLPPSSRSPASPMGYDSRLLSPSVAASQVAAWEAARIAKKFDFDVVYVANFWPSQTNYLHSPSDQGAAATTASSPVSATSSSLSSPISQYPGTSMLSSPVSGRFTSRSYSSTPRHSVDDSYIQVPAKLSERPLLPMADCCPDSGKPLRKSNALKGCLLAAYGLETIVAPFKLSTRVHKKILRTQGWIEHRNSAAKENEFARGYALSFYTGTTPDPQAGPCTPKRLSLDDEMSVQRSFAANPDPVTPPRSGGQYCAHKYEAARSQTVINRGLVFVAYRRPRGPGGSVNSSPVELDALGKEAKALVDMILDFHLENRRWNAAREVI